MFIDSNNFLVIEVRGEILLWVCEEHSRSTSWGKNSGLNGERDEQNLGYTRSTKKVFRANINLNIMVKFGQKNKTYCFEKTFKLFSTALIPQQSTQKTYMTLCRKKLCFFSTLTA